MIQFYESMQKAKTRLVNELTSEESEYESHSEEDELLFYNISCN